MKAQNFCEFIVSGNTTIWNGCYPAAQSAGITCGWMSYSSPTDYLAYLNSWANIDYSYFFSGTSAVANPRYTLQSYIDAEVELSVFNADTDVEISYILAYYDDMKAICSNYPSKLIEKIKNR